VFVLGKLIQPSLMFAREVGTHIYSS